MSAHRRRAASHISRGNEAFPHAILLIRSAQGAARNISSSKGKLSSISIPVLSINGMGGPRLVPPSHYHGTYQSGAEAAPRLMVASIRCCHGLNLTMQNLTRLDVLETRRNLVIRSSNSSELPASIWRLGDRAALRFWNAECRRFPCDFSRWENAALARFLHLG